MSKTRMTVRLFLVLVLLGMLWIGYRHWQRGRPDYYWHKAQAAASAGNVQAEKIYLENLLQRYPKHDAGHLAMARLCLEEAKAAKRPATYAANPEALRHLAEAARLRPADLDLQKQLLEAYLESRQMHQAARVAARVVEKEPDSADALFALLWQAVDTRNAAAADRRLQQLHGVSSRYAFQTLALAAKQHKAEGKGQEFQEDLEAACRLAGELDGRRLASLAKADVDAFPGLVLAAVAKAPDTAIAHERAQDALHGFETTAKSQPQRVGQMADAACRTMAVLEEKHPLGKDAAVQRAVRQRFAQQAGRLRAAAITAGHASPLVYQQSAEAEFAAGRPDAGLRTIQEGLAANAKLPASRMGELLSLHLSAARQLVRLRRFAEAEGHLKVLCAHKQSAGMGRLLAGSIALQEGKLERALDQFSRAQEALGNTLPVRVGLAATYLRLRRWQEALPHVDALSLASRQADPQQQAWIRQHLGSSDQLQLAQLQANLALGRWDQAQTHLDALAGSPLQPQALASAVEYLWKKKETSRALAMLADARKRFPHDRDLVRLEAATLTATGKTDEAGRLLEKFAADAPDDLAAQLLLCDWRLKSHRAGEALKQLETLESKHEAKPQEKLAITALKAKALMALGRPKEAAALVEPLRADPRTAAVAGVIAAAAELTENDRAGALKALNEAGKADPRNAVLSLLQGKMEAAQGDHATAVSSLARSLDTTALRGPSQIALLSSILSLARQKSPAEAQAKVDELLKQHPDNLGLLLAKADLHYEQGRFDAAMAVLDRAERLQPKSEAPAYLKAWLWLNSGRPDRAVTEIRRALALRPGHLPSLVLAANASLAAGQDADALDYARAALKQAPKASSAALVEAEALERLKRPEEAVGVLEGLIASQPKLAEGYFRLGAAHAAAGRRDKALEVYRQGRRQLPDDLRLLSAEIGALVTANKLDEARKVANQAAGPKPDWQQCLALGQAFAAGRQFQTARDWGQRAMALADEQQKPAVHLMLGNLALLQRGQGSDPGLAAQARDHFAAVVKAQPRNFLAANNLAWLLATEFGQPQEAIRVAERARDKAAVAELPATFVDTLAVAYRKAKRPDDARHLLEEALKRDPDQPKLLFQLGCVFAEAKQPSPARGALQRALELGLPADEAGEAQRVLGTLRDKPSGAPVH